MSGNPYTAEALGELRRILLAPDYLAEALQPALGELLRDESAQLTDQLVAALTPVLRQAVREALQAELADPAPEVLESLAQALKQRRPEGRGLLGRLPLEARSKAREANDGALSEASPPQARGAPPTLVLALAGASFAGLMALGALGGSEPHTARRMAQPTPVVASAGLRQVALGVHLPAPHLGASAEAPTASPTLKPTFTPVAVDQAQAAEPATATVDVTAATMIPTDAPAVAPAAADAATIAPVELATLPPTDAPTETQAPGATPTEQPASPTPSAPPDSGPSDGAPSASASGQVAELEAPQADSQTASPAAPPPIERGTTEAASIQAMSMAAPLAATARLVDNHAHQARDKVLYLTFDDGPNGYFTPQVLGILAEHQAQATFFVIGQEAERRPELIDQMVAQGHVVGHHTWSHAALIDIDREALLDEIERTGEALGDAISPYLRPPGGEIDQKARDVLDEQGIEMVRWTIDTEDWRGRSAEQIASTVISQARPGQIVLLHDGGGDRTATVAALPVILTTLREEGYTFAALSRR